MGDFFQFTDSERTVIDISRILAFAHGYCDEKPTLELFTSTTEFFQLTYHDMGLRNFDYTVLVNHVTGVPDLGDL